MILETIQEKCYLFSTMNIGLRILAVFLSSILFGIAIPNEISLSGCFTAGLLALIPFYFAIADIKNPKTTGRLTGLLVFLTHIISSFWLSFFEGFAIFTLGASALATYAFGCIMGRLLWLCFQEPVHLRPFLFSCVWVIWEWLKSNGFLAYPWGTLIMTTTNCLPLVQIVDITGTWGLSFLISLFSAICSEWLLLLTAPKCSLYKNFLCKSKSYKKTITVNSIFVSGCFAIVLIYGCYSLLNQTKPDDYLKLTVVQHNGDSWNDSLEDAMLSCQDLTRNVAHKTPSDLVAWSETILTFPYKENKEYYEIFPRNDAFIPFLKETNIPVITGAPVLMSRKPLQFSNSVLLLSPDGDIVKTYGKMQLVPFAEYIPFFEHEWMQKLMKAISGLTSTWTPGNTITLFPVELKSGKTINFTAPICFEDAFPNVCRKLYKQGSDVFINLTNDSWSKTKSAEMQHFTISFFRAIEFRTSMVRSTNAGFTCVIDSCGRVLDSLPLFEKVSKEFTVPIYPRTETFYCIFGDWLPLFCAILLLFAFFINYSNFFQIRYCKIRNPLL